jgi:hypothetical protein
MYSIKSKFSYQSSYGLWVAVSFHHLEEIYRLAGDGGCAHVWQGAHGISLFFPFKFAVL